MMSSGTSNSFRLRGGRTYRCASVSNEIETKDVSMGRKLTTIRKTKYAAQKGLCYYCRQPTWVKDGIAFCKIHRLSARFAARLQCTAEHLVARCDGGCDRADNIVAACLFCNRTRQITSEPKALQKPRPAKTPRRKMARVQSTLAQDKWIFGCCPGRNAASCPPAG